MNSRIDRDMGAGDAHDEGADDKDAVVVAVGCDIAYDADAVDTALPTPLRRRVKGLDGLWKSINSKALNKDQAKKDFLEMWLVDPTFATTKTKYAVQLAKIEEWVDLTNL